MPQSSSNESDSNKNLSDALSIFCREVRNLLRSKANCMIPFSKFVPAYHNHYGRQCCVYQFGCTKLIELLESIPHVVQIVGEGNNRYITLTHREQIKRFASDLIKVVKSQPGKILKLSQFSSAYEQVLGRTFRVEDYGTNNINVLLAEIWEGTINIMPIKRELVDKSIEGPLFVAPSIAVPSQAGSRGGSRISSSAASSSLSLTSRTSPPIGMPGLVVSRSPSATTISSSDYGHPRASQLEGFGEMTSATILNQLVAKCELVGKPYITEQYPDAWFEVPKRERSDKEIKRTKYFVRDVIELLSHMDPDYSVSFSKFIPSYHYYFNRQCKVSIFGFSKLIDLFESISPDVVEIIDQGAGQEKIIKLAEQHLPFKARSRLPLQAHSVPIMEVCPKPAESDGFKRNDDCDDEEVASDDEIIICQNIRDDSASQTSDEDSYDADVRDRLNEASSDTEEDEGDDVLLPADAIDNGPTEEELEELEDELKAYEELKAIQSKRSNRMAAILDIFKYSVY